MSASRDLQNAVEAILRLAIPQDVPVLVRRKGELVSDIEAAAASCGICLWVMPPFPTSAIQGIPEAFFDRVELRVRILEYHAVNSGPDRYELIETVANALHWQPNSGIDQALAAFTQQGLDTEAAADALKADPAYDSFLQLSRMLSHPLYLASRPVEIVGEDEEKAVIDVIFTAVFQLT